MVDSSAHFKTAAAHIRRGIEAKHAQIAELRHSVEIMQQEAKKHVQSVKLKITAIEVLIAEAQQQSGDQTDTNRADRMNTIRQMYNEITEKEHNMERERDQITAHIKDIERDIAGLEPLSKSLESKT